MLRHAFSSIPNLPEASFLSEAHKLSGRPSPKRATNVIPFVASGSPALGMLDDEVEGILERTLFIISGEGIHPCG